MTSCFVYKVIRDLESIDADHVCINPVDTSDLLIRISEVKCTRKCFT